MLVNVNISVGELMDKFTILQIKRERIMDPVKVNEVSNELLYLEKIVNELFSHKHIPRVVNDLKSINEILWDIEDQIRIKECNNEFDDEFIQLARKVYLINDSRFRVKSIINQLCGSTINEVKSYEDY